MNSQELENYLKASSPEERIQALIEFYKKWADSSKDGYVWSPNNIIIIEALRWAKKAASEDGWKEIAPAWLEEARRLD